MSGGVDDVAAEGFGRGAADYERGRPGYPQAAFDHLIDHLPINPRTRVLDLAAGTGKLTRLLDGTGADVVAVEPVAGMRHQLEVVLPDVEVLDGTAEAIPLGDESVDAVTVAQAFHWFDVDLAMAEIRRVLRPGGGLAMLWNRRDERTPWVGEMSRVLGWHDHPQSRYEDTDWAVGVEGHGFSALRLHEVRWEQPMTRDLLAARVRSISYVAADTEEHQAELAAAVVDLVADRPEPFPLPYTTSVYWCHRS